MKNFLIFQEIELSSPKLKIVLIFSQKKALLVIWEIELFKKKHFLYFRRELSKKSSYTQLKS